MNKNILLSFLLLKIVVTDTYSQNVWMQKADYGGTARRDAVAFSIGNKGYIGTGGDGVSNNSGKAFWEYDPMPNVWTQKATFAGSSRINAVGFAIGNYGYIGTGSDVDDFWQYDPVSNTWIQKADFPGGPRSSASGFSIENKGYLGFGEGGGPNLKKDLWEYDPSTDIWTLKAQIGGKGRAGAPAFAIGNKGYVVGGAVTTSAEPSRDVWEYDPATDSWSEKTSFPGEARESAVGFALTGKGYYGTGFFYVNDYDVIALNDFWEYDPATDSWVQKANLPGVARYNATGLAIGNKGYIGTGYTYDSTCACFYYLKDFWEYTPDCEVPAGLTTTNIKSTSAKVNWSLEPAAQTYSVRYRKTGTVPWTKTTAQLNYKKLTGLSPDTQYDWAVKSVCDPVNAVSSDWSATQNYTTKPLRLENESGEEISLEVFPNPSSGSFNLSCQFSLKVNREATVEIVDQLERCVSTYTVEVSDGLIDQQFEGINVPPGFYLVHLSVDGEIYKARIVFQ